jgi:hypothetical protein
MLEVSSHVEFERNLIMTVKTMPLGSVIIGNNKLLGAPTIQSN